MNPNQWCVDGEYQVFKDTKVLNYKGMMTQLVMVEHRVFMGSLHTILDVQRFFTRQTLEWNERTLWTYGKKIVREFYDSYVRLSVLFLIGG